MVWYGMVWYGMVCAYGMAQRDIHNNINCSHERVICRRRMVYDYV